MAAVVSVHAFVSGRVQGVFYRASLAKQASALGLTGWVRNLADGRVEYVAQGDEKNIAALLAWSADGPPLARVSSVESNVLEDAQTFCEFLVRR